MTVWEVIFTKELLGGDQILHQWDGWMQHLEGHHLFHGSCAGSMRNRVGKERQNDVQEESDRDEGKLLVKATNWDEMGDEEHKECCLHHGLEELMRLNC